MTIRTETALFATVLALLAVAFSSHGFSEDLESGEDAYIAEDYAKAMEILLPLAESNDTSPTGDSIAQFYVGEMYYYGHGVPQSYAEAIVWYNLSAVQGDPDSQYSLGYIYDEGEGVVEDDEQALSWYGLAAVQKYLPAQVRLANLYLNGDGVAHNPTEAILWLRTAAELNNIDAQYQLGEIYESGELVASDLNEAIKWYRYAATQGDVESLEAINRIYGREDFVENYNHMLRDLGISRPDADALFCENFSWAFSLVNSSAAKEEGNLQLERFTAKALERVGEFRSKLAQEFDQEGYSEDPAYREAVNELAYVGESHRLELQARIDTGDQLDIIDQGFLARDDGGALDLAYSPSFWDHFEAMSQDEVNGYWDYCTAKYMPSGFFRSNIGLEKLQEAANSESSESSIYYSALDYGNGIIDWSRTKYEDIKSIDVCEGDLDLAGGVAIGTAATSVMAGDSVLMIVGSSGILIATAPAIATGVTITAVAGATVYAGARGYCYFFNSGDET